jgi:hypothetical protein
VSELVDYLFPIHHTLRHYWAQARDSHHCWRSFGKGGDTYAVLLEEDGSRLTREVLCGFFRTSFAVDPSFCSRSCGGSLRYHKVRETSPQYEQILSVLFSVMPDIREPFIVFDTLECVACTQLPWTASENRSGYKRELIQNSF